MKYKSIYILTAIFLFLTVVIFMCSDDSQGKSLFSFELLSDDSSENIAYWIDEDDEYYVFIPSYGELSRLSVKLNTETEVNIGNVKLTEGMSCDEFKLNTLYELCYQKWGKTYSKSITFVRSGGVPAMYVDTLSGNMEYIHQKKGNEESGSMRLYSPNGDLNYTGDIKSINGRGNSTWDSFDKKPYSITLKENADLLQMGAAQKWILLANADDPSHIRNKLVFEFAKEAGLAYSPDSQWVDLYLNGEYAGLYLLCERNEIHPHRVDISADNSFLVSLEMEERLIDAEITYVSTESGQALRVHNPVLPTAESLNEIGSLWQTFENAVLSENGTDPGTGTHWSELVDVDSWAKKYLIEEVFGNCDACTLSQFFYYDGNSESAKIYAGPVWDYDLSMGRKTSWQISEPNVLIANQLEVKSGYENPWFNALYQNDEFHNRITEMYEIEFRPLINTLIDERIDAYTAKLTEASAMNQLRWKNYDISCTDEAEVIREYMTQRISFLDSMWIEGEEYVMVRADSSFGVNYAYYAVRPGEKLNSLPDFEGTEDLSFTGWYYVDSGEPFDAERPINEYTEIYAKWENHKSRLSYAVKLLPVAVFSGAFACVFLADIFRNRKRKG